MKTIGNIIWVVFSGLQIAIEYFLSGLALMITIIGIPFGKMHFRLENSLFHLLVRRLYSLI